MTSIDLSLRSTCGKQSVSHTNTTMCGSFNFLKLYQGYSSVVRVLGVFEQLHVRIRDDECA
jgi:hypothetical protein